MPTTQTNNSSGALAVGQAGSKQRADSSTSCVPFMDVARTHKGANEKAMRDMPPQNKSRRCTVVPGNTRSIVYDHGVYTIRAKLLEARPHEA